MTYRCIIGNDELKKYIMNYHIMSVTAFNQNCSLVWCKQTGEAMLVDPGGEAQRLRREVNNFGVTIKQITLTHGHLDHVGAATELAQYYNVPIIGPHRDDKPLLDNLIDQCQMFGVKPVSTVLPDRWLINGETIKIGEEIFSVLHCPGHSPGHVVFYNKIRKFALVGDLLFKDGISRTDLPGGDKQALIYSIQHQLMLLADDVTFLPGHGQMSTLGHERRANSFFIASNTQRKGQAKCQ